MKEYIEREAALASIRHEDPGFAYAIERVPAADVRPVVRGVWRGIGKTGRIFVCSACDKTFPYKTRYCPNCGADMREE